MHEIAGALLKAIFYLLHLIVQLLLNVLLQIGFEIFGSLVKAMVQGSRVIALLMWQGADRLYDLLLRIAGRLTQRRRLAHALVMSALVVCGFSAGAGASASYRFIHTHHSAPAARQP